MTDLVDKPDASFHDGANLSREDRDLLIELRTIVLLMKQQLDQMTGNFVTQAEFWPVKVLVYGCTGLMLTALVGALLFLVLQHPYGN